MMKFCLPERYLCRLSALCITFGKQTQWRFKTTNCRLAITFDKSNKFSLCNRPPLGIACCYKFCALVLFTATSRVCPKRFEKPPLRDEKK